MKANDMSQRPFSSKEKFLVGFCLAAFLAIFVVGCGKKEEKKVEKTVTRPVKILTLTPSSSTSQRRYPGKVRASQRVDLAFKVAGPLIELPIEEGEKVKKAQLIARIDPRDFETDLAKIKSDISRARARLKAMQVGARPEDLRILEAEVASAKARLLNAEQQYKRYRELYIRKQVSKADFDRYTSERDVARANLNTAIQNLEKGKKGARQEDIDAMKAQIRSLEANQKRLQDSLNDTYLKAPFSGVIAKRYVENFEEVRAKQPIVSLQDISRIEVLVAVPEMVMATIRGEGKVEAFAEFAASPGKQYPLTLKEYSSEADPKTQTYQITFEMPQPEGINVLPGMTANVIGKHPSGEQPIDRFVIPAVAVFADDAGKSHVWVVDEASMTVHRRPVTTGELTGTEGIQILDGLKSGEKIAVTGIAQLREGMHVRDLGQEGRSR